MADLTMLCPSRGRPMAALELHEAVKATATADTELIFIVDADDPSRDLYYWHLTRAGGRAITVAPTRRGMVAALNEGFRMLDDSLGYAVGFLGDDHRPRTVGWDQAYLDELRKLKTGIVYGNDLLQGEAMATQVAMTTDIPRRLGGMSPAELDHMCVDLVWLDWGRGIKRLSYLPEVVVEHMHPSVGKGTQDASYALTGALLGADSTAYEAYRSGQLVDDLKALKSLLRAPSRKRVAK